jgi:hypothetical protein
VEFQLAVFDRAIRGQTFSAIARELRRPVPTVKSAYFSAGHQIFGAVRNLSKKQATVESIDDPQAHWETCKTCSRVATADEACPQMRLLINRDSRGRAERLGTTRDVADDQPPRRSKPMG